MIERLYELRELASGRHRILLVTPDVDRAYQLLTALRTADHEYEVAEQGGPILSDGDLLQRIREKEER